MANFAFKTLAVMSFASYVGFGIVAITKPDIPTQKEYAGYSVSEAALACAACIGAGLSTTKRRRFQ